MPWRAWQEILDIIRESSATFDSVNIATSFHRLATVSIDHKFVRSSPEFASLTNLAGEVSKILLWLSHSTWTHAG